ncbi:LysE family translocator [Breoghania sp. L-A4]|uniref:LysE family translocator n=1 Tax=Breoghania sp. L-A4 TaxID=2304600 RepID=UPI000E35AB0F|nr:LysE family translocator [Breoghania sp. L-A4]AXS40253.1 LysE family translocator [Breoghania sp. L-A4]
MPAIMSLDQYLLLCLYIIALTGTPGPANVAFLAYGSTYGVRRTVPFWLGTLFGFSMIYVLAVAGLLAIVTGLPWLWNALRVACLGYIVYLAWTIAMASPRPVDAPMPADSRAPGFLRGFWVHPLNPKAYAMQIAAISQFVSPERYVADATTIAITFFCLGGAVNFGWIAGGRILARLANSPLRFRIVNGTLAALMLVSTAVSLQMA